MIDRPAIQESVHPPQLYSSSKKHNNDLNMSVEELRSLVDSVFNHLLNH